MKSNKKELFQTKVKINSLCLKPCLLHPLYPNKMWAEQLEQNEESNSA